MTTERTIKADRLIARIMRLAQGDLHAVWTTAGIVKVIEEECKVAKYTDALEKIREIVHDVEKDAR